MPSNVICDFDFQSGDRAFINFIKNGVDSQCMVTVLGKANTEELFYVIAGPATIIEETKNIKRFFDVDAFKIPTNWIISLADPDELEPAHRNLYKIVDNTKGENS